MWRIRPTKPAPDTYRWSLVDEVDRALTFETVIHHWSESGAFCEFWCTSLRGAPFDAYAWECPPLTAATSSRAFECVFVASPMLARMPQDPEAFGEHFRHDRSVVTFGNLGGDAVLVAPCPGGAGSNYSQLATFVATAPVSQQDAVWEAVGQAMKRRIGSSPVWLNTAGLGVAWLHLRLDDRPKYFRHLPYTRP